MTEKKSSANHDSTALAGEREKIRLVLASLSPRRKELLDKLGLVFEAIPSHVDEDFSLDWSPQTVVLHLAEQKGRAVRNLVAKSSDQALAILSADTIVVADGEILNKPADDQEALSMLRKLSGRQHDVFTGVALLFYQAGTRATDPETKILKEVEKTIVTMRALGEQEMTSYVQTKEPHDKAGGYAIQGIASAFVSKIDGCFSNVVGLPVPVTVKMLRRVGIKVLGA